ncbi:hypothetical protein MKW92_017038 [Papaver armeniacum]|nr:hypothetical protein MKW92_017038 [Papaver armeniacum]
MDLVSLISEAVLRLTKDGVITQELGIIWRQMRGFILIPTLNVAVFLCLTMSVMLFIERLYMGKRFKWEEMKDDVELGNSNYPMVLVQIPMYNEKEVYQLSIGAACALSWPSDRIIIQVLDDSTDPVIKDLVEIECRMWASKGINIKYEIRSNRNGYKAGALKEGLKHSYVDMCDFVTIFDADFQPDPDFLYKSIPYFVHNPEVGLVQARWKFVNANECLMTRVQEMSLNYHFRVEQEVGSSTYAFFGFNGTAGVWRIAAIREAGGWKDRTTVEDMDLAVRASLKGWKFVYVGAIKVKSELPSTFKAFRYQQHRWSCGPANLFRKMVMEIIRNQTVDLWQKVHVIYSFFLVRKIIAHIVTFSFYCVVIPTCVFFPEVVVPIWGVFYVPTIITVLNAIETPRSIHLVIFWVLFENVMSLHRSKGTLIGILEAGGRVNEWVVTEKLGDTLLKPKDNNKPDIKSSKKSRFSAFRDRLHLLELGMGTYILVCACYDAMFGKYWYFVYLFGQTVAFYVMGFGYVVLQLTRDGVVQELGVVWQHTRELLIVPILKFAVFICLTMSVMLFIERVYMGVVILFVKLSGRKPEKRYKWEEIKDDVETGNSNYPMVLVQIPMYNEKEVYQLSIGAACALAWPSNRIIIQVLDDSTDPDIKDLVEIECRMWASKGINIKYEIRSNRTGYKAGALKEGLKQDYVEACDFVAIFDADFQPDPDFLRRSIPYFVHNPDVGLVQARWKFVNASECLMTRVQEMSLNYHFRVEQEVGSSTYAFFGFNGTAGVWRIAAIKEAGGWKDRTTVEDMDLAVRASLMGWKFVYIGALKVKSELPSTFKAFRYQQHRWSCGPANLFRKMVLEIIKNKTVNLWKKIYLMYSFFLVRKIVAHIVTFSFYCVVIPMCVFFPEVVIPLWGLFYMPTVITILNAIETPRSIHLVICWVLFENVMSLHRTKGTFIGLFEAGGRVNEWVVTEKLGDALLKSKENNSPAIKSSKKSRFAIFRERLHLLELGMGTYILVCACYDLLFGKYWYFIYLFGQTIAFFIMGFGYIGTLIPPS